MKKQRQKMLFWLSGFLALGVVILLVVAAPQSVQSASPVQASQLANQNQPLQETPAPPTIENFIHLGVNASSCANPIAIACGTMLDGDTSQENSNIDSYSCNSWDESGPESIYAFTLPAGGTYSVTASLSGHSVDLDVFLLSDCNAAQCMPPIGGSSGDNEFTAMGVSAGTYYVAVDGYEGAAGTYTLHLDCVTEGNNPPNAPSNPSPADKATGVSTNPTLSWTGGDPDGDTVLYTVYGQKASDVTSQVWCAASTKTTCQRALALQPNTEYHWWIRADDQKFNTTDGPFWEFTTGSSGKIYLPLILQILKGSPSPSPSPSATATQPPKPTTPAPPLVVTPDPSATTPTPPASGQFTRFINNSSYPIISMKVDNVEEFPNSPLGILPGYYYDMALTAGQHHVHAYNGYWEGDGSRSTFYQWEGNFTQPVGAREDVPFDDPTIVQYMTNFAEPPASSYWEGEYWTGFPVTRHTAGFCFYTNSKYRFYLDRNMVQTQDGTGTYTLLDRQPDVFTVTFQVTNDPKTKSMDGTYYETEGFFFMKNGPADWQTIQYYRQDNIICDPAP